MPAQPELFLTAQAVDIAGFGEVGGFQGWKVNPSAGEPDQLTSMVARLELQATPGLPRPWS